MSFKRYVYPLSTILILYMASYFVFSDTYYGAFQETKMKFRIFRYPFETALWAPMLRLEGWMTSREFYPHVASGVSLPPPDPHH